VFCRWSGILGGEVRITFSSWRRFLPPSRATEYFIPSCQAHTRSGAAVKDGDEGSNCASGAQRPLLARERRRAFGKVQVELEENALPEDSLQMRGSAALSRKRNTKRGKERQEW